MSYISCRDRLFFDFAVLPKITYILMKKKVVFFRVLLHM